MKSSTSKLLAVILTLAIMLLLAACGTTNTATTTSSQQTQKETQQSVTETQKEVNLKVLIRNGDDKWRKAFDYAFEDISKKYSNYKLEVERFDGDANSYETKLRTYVSAGTTPDVFFCHGGTFAQPILTAKVALSLGEYLDKLKYWDTVISSSKRPSADGNIYAIYLEQVNYEMMLANTGLFKKFDLKVPKTYKELADAVKVFKQNNITSISVGAKDGWPADMLVEGFAYTVDPECTLKIVKGETNYTNNEAYKKSAEAIKQLIDLGAFTKNVALTDYTTAMDYFLKGNAAIWSIGSWAIDDAVKALGADNVEVLYYPVLDEANVDQYGKNAAGGVKPDAGIFVSSTTKAPEDAAKVAIEISTDWNKVIYEDGDISVIYKPDVLGWKTITQPTQQKIQFMKDVAGFTKGTLILQDALPTAVAAKAAMDSSAAFLTGQITVEDYLKNMDKGLESK